MAIEFRRTVPILRMFSVEKAKEFYLGFLGFSLDWEHRFEPDTPVYMQVSRNGVVLHLSERHGDGTPGTAIFADMDGIDEFHREISTKRYKYCRPGIQRMPWKARMMAVIDPFGNHIRFNEHTKPARRKHKRKL
jgi:catechol 2,3-dioxygenase-like lactoylglutathione lyase family enzyme